MRHKTIYELPCFESSEEEKTEPILTKLTRRTGLTGKERQELLRKRRSGGMTQATIAQALGVSQKSVSNWLI